jgi:predicted ArsR family transcriptional regulator
MDRGRCKAMRRLWSLLVLLRTGRYTLEELAGQLGVTGRTIRRDLDVLEACYLPVHKQEGFTGPEGKPSKWFMDPMPQWPRREASPIADLPDQHSGEGA